MPKNRLIIHLIKPSKYDDDGYVVHHVRGVLPSNTLYALNALFQSAARNLGIEVALTLHDETVKLIKAKNILRSYTTERVLVCLIGVQTNQFPRAVDIANKLLEKGAQVIIGGFHVSGTVAMLGLTDELRALQEKGISLFIGEAESRLEELITDALFGQLKPIYQGTYPNLSVVQELPKVDNQIAKRFVLPFFGTIDCSRGCVFRCSFCTIINVQGNSIRARDPAIIESHIRRGYPQVRYYFFTDDNMARNPRWRELFERLIAIRNEGLDVRFMMQVDTLAYKIPDFALLASKAGCTQVFIGIESLNQENLLAVSKKQNRVDRFEAMGETWRQNGIAIHAAYIIGFPHDSKDSVDRDLGLLINEVKPDQASFFMLTPLPGSADHKQMYERREWMSQDFNEYDSFHATSNHPRMSKEEWKEAYARAWSRFYSLKNVEAILKRTSPQMYWQVFKNAAWYLYAIRCEKQHPMITGFWRLKGRTERRSCHPRESHVIYLMKRVRDNAKLSWRLIKLLFFMEKIWRRTWFECRGNKALAGKWQPQNTQLKFLSIAAYFIRRANQAYFQIARSSQANLKSCFPFKKSIRSAYCSRLAEAVASPLRIFTKGWLFFLNFVLEV